MPPVSSARYRESDRHGGPNLKKVGDASIQKAIPIEFAHVRMRLVETREGVRPVDEPGVVAVQVVLHIHRQSLRIEIQPADIAVTKPVLIEGNPRREIPRRIGNKRSAHSPVPEKVAFLEIADEKRVARVVEALAGEEGPHLRPVLARNQ